jgi:hypothetical protein
VAIAIGLLKTLLELARATRTGVLDAVASGVRVRLFIEEGVVVNADSGGVGETLGRILVREKVITQEQYTAALEWTADLRSRGKHARIGEVFVELGMLTPEQLNAALSAQVRQKVVRALGWTATAFTFVECHGPLEIDGRYPTPLEPLVLAALRLAEPDAVDKLFEQARDRWVALRGDPVPGGGSTGLETIARLNALRLKPAEETFVRSLDGTRTVAELLDTTDAVDPAVLLAALLLTDCLDLHGAPQGAPASSRAPAPRPSAPKLVPPRPTARTSGTLVSSQSSTPPRPKRSSVHPPPPEQKAEVKKVASRLRSAHAARRALAPASSPAEAPETPPMPATPFGPMARLLAEKAFQAGRRLVRANQLTAAATELARAASLYPAAEYDLWAAWAEMRCAPEGEGELVEKLRSAAERALDVDPELGFAWFALSWITRRNGDEVRADELLERARALDADAIDDARDIRIRAAEPSAPAVTRGEVRALAAPIGRIALTRVAVHKDKDGPPPTAPHVVVSPRASSEAPPANRAVVDTTATAAPASAPADSAADTQRAAVTGPAPGEVGPAPGAGLNSTLVMSASAKLRSTAIMTPRPPPARVAGAVPGVARSPSSPEAAPPATAVPSAPASSEPRPSSRPPPSYPETVKEFPAPDPNDDSTPRIRSSAPVTSGDGAGDDDAAVDAPPESVPAIPAGSGGGRTMAVAVAVLLGLVVLGYSLERYLGQRALEALDAGAFAKTAEADAGAAPAAPAAPSASETPSAALATSADAAPPRAPAATAPTVATTSAAATTSATSATSAPSPVPSAAADAAAAAIVAVAEDAAAPRETPDDEARPIGPTEGRLDLPRSANGHRVWVDGHLVGEPPAPIVVACGHHVVKVGSNGREQEVDVPCGGRISVPYP